MKDEKKKKKIFLDQNFKKVLHLHINTIIDNSREIIGLFIVLYIGEAVDLSL
ncbi:MAG: hypothetical protein V6002_01850 [Candidatus Dasytiphilus stammeri]